LQRICHQAEIHCGELGEVHLAKSPLFRVVDGQTDRNQGKLAAFLLEE
jgi:hypothetical protein